MPLRKLRETMRLRLVERGAPADVVAGYLDHWDGELLSEGQKPLPCPDCFSSGKISRLNRIPSPAGIGIVKCPSCEATFEFPDFEGAAGGQGTWPTRR